MRLIEKAQSPVPTKAPEPTQAEPKSRGRNLPRSKDDPVRYAEFKDYRVYVLVPIWTSN
jgi:hypothetical protein